MDTKHYATERISRTQIIDSVIGRGHVLKKVYWDKGHFNGPELHCITDTGIIEIYNIYSGKHITDLIARPNQINRLYKMHNKTAPKWLLDIAYNHQKLGYNYA